MKKKSKKKKRKVISSRENAHHLLWQRKHWNIGYIHKLREHWYMRVEIPKDTLHRYIHENMEEIPTPNAVSAKIMLEMLDLLEERGFITPYDDIEKRLAVLLELTPYNEFCMRVAVKKQLRLVRNYNEGGR